MCTLRSTPMSGKSIRKMLSLRDLKTKQAVIAKSLRVDPSTVSKWFKKATQLSLDYAKAETMSDDELEETFNRTMGRKRICQHPVDLESFVAKAGGRKKIEKVYLLYRKEAAKSGSKIEPVSRATFFRRVKEYRAERKSEYAMVMVWVVRQYMQIDLCGDVIELMPSDDGQPQYCYVFVATLPATGMTFAKAVPGKKSVDWCEGIVAAFEFFQGRTEFILCDNDVALAAKAACGAQEMTKGFETLAQTYGFEVEYARPGHPRDKAAVESAVGRIEEEILPGIDARSMKSCDDVQRLLDKGLETMNAEPNSVTKVSPVDDFRLREQPNLIQISQYSGWTRSGPKKRRIIDESRCVKIDGHYYLMPYSYKLRTIDVVETEDDQLLFFRPGYNKVEACYTHFKKKDGSQEGFKHAKPEFRAPNEVTDDVQLSREMEKFAGFGENAKNYAARYVAARARKSKRMVAQQLGFLRRPMKGLDPKVVEEACSHALAMHDFDKENFLIYLEATRKMAEQSKKDGRKKDKPTCKGACLRNNTAKAPRFPRLEI